MHIIERLPEVDELFKIDKILPEGFEEGLEKVKEEIKNMQDQDQGAEEAEPEGEFEYDNQEAQDESNIYDQIGHFTEPTISKKILNSKF